MQSMEDHRLCLVCSAPIHSTHLGMDICRACASFFKRAKVIGREYPCRQGTRQCTVSKENHFVCRRCRFDKCLAVGVNYDGPLRVRAKPTYSLFRRIEMEFKSLIERRRTKELALMRALPHRVIVPHHREEIYFVNMSSSMDLHKIFISETWIFLENAFPALKQLSKEDIDVIFHEYILKLALIISYYLTQKLWGDVRTKFMKSIVTCYDTEAPLDSYFPSIGGNQGMLESSIRAYTKDLGAIFLPQFERAQLTGHEWHALIALVLTEHEMPISEKAEQIMDGIRHEIFENLQIYYQTEMGLTDYSERFGNLMSLNHTIQESQSLYKVTARFYSTFFESIMPERFIEALKL
ncbi:hypothetical protein PENTCL1PPCAC_8529 [Pristionchus entomophagus]|uniref:Nuclear receptor domain-containing protein n=1 Tax=Pristionchus entomophagus TaxID=358040 RepID=A0AAV5SYC1_9BILA|nr:hypothetical protein PENTCL1PPCAC_8529 [Pristionchus entomophagus]